MTLTSSPGDDEISKAELRLTDIADTLQGDWVSLAHQLGITQEEIVKIQSEYTFVSEQALVMLHLWVQKNGENATGERQPLLRDVTAALLMLDAFLPGNDLERGLRKIGREDVIKNCMYNVEEVTDDVEKAAAKMQLDHDQAGGYLVFETSLHAAPHCGLIVLLRIR